MSDSPMNPVVTAPTVAPAITVDNKSPVAAAPASRGVFSMEAWSPLKVELFRTIWTTSLIANIGMWAREASGPWMMSLLKSTPLFVSLVTMASTLPFAILSVPAGVLSDMYDRRKFLRLTQIWMMVVSFVLGMLIVTHHINAIWLLLLTFLMGIGSALSQPPFQAIVPELVPPADMPLAVALNSVMLNLSRAIGPALAGVIITYMGVGSSFFFTALCFIPVIFALTTWHRPQQKPSQPETVAGAVAQCIRYARHTMPLWAVLLRTSIFISCAMSMWGMLPNISKAMLHGAAGTQGMIMAFLGVGAVVGVVIMPALQRRLSIDGMVAICTVLYGIGLITLSFTHGLWTACPVMAFIGFNWVIVPTNFNIATQRSVPNWVKGRALGLYQTALWGTWALAAPVWGGIATAHGVPTALYRSGLGVIVGVAAAFVLKLTYSLGQDFSPDKRAPLVIPENNDALSNGTVWVAVDYRISPENRGAFRALKDELRRQRLRNGATTWRMSDATTDGVITECYAFPTWAARVRHHERTTKADAAIENQIIALQTDGAVPAPRYSSEAPVAAPPEGPGWFTLATQGAGRAVVSFSDRGERARQRDMYSGAWKHPKGPNLR